MKKSFLLLTAILSFVILPTVAEAKYRGGGGSRSFSKSKSYSSKVKRVAPTKKVTPKKASKRTEPVKKKVAKPAPVKKKVEPKKVTKPTPVKKDTQSTSPTKTTIVRQNNTVNRTESSGGGFLANVGATMAGMWLFGTFFGGDNAEPTQEYTEPTPEVQEEVK